MYLKARRYVGGWEFSDGEERNQFERLVAMYGMEGFITDHSPHAYVEFCVAYWRKANQIHDWFVKNVQDGKDECLPNYTPREKLVELRDLCREVLAASELVVSGEHEVNYIEEGKLVTKTEPRKIVGDPSTALDLLPPKEGFFFGSYSLDEWYVRDLEDTVAQLDKVLKLPKGWEFVYESSW